MEAWVAAAAFLGIVALLVWGRRPPPWLGGRRGRLPRQLELDALEDPPIPADAEAPLDYLTRRLSDLGFEPAGHPARVPALHRLGHRVLVVPFVHPHERAYFLMGIDAGRGAKSQLILHIISELTDGRRVETSTLEALDQFRAASNVDAQVVLDAESVDEIWSRHRLALTRYRRELRAEVPYQAWPAAARDAYEGWVRAAVRAQRLQLDADGQMYKVRARPRSVW